MTYRRDGERLRVENEELRRDLDEARRAIQRLEGSASAPKTTPVLARIIGGSADATVEQSVPGSLDDEKVGAALDYLTQHFDTSGVVAQFGKRLAWSTPHTFEQPDDVSVVIEERDGAVRVRARKRPARFGVGVYALFVGLVLPMLFAVAAAIGHAPSLVFVVPLLLLSVLVARGLFATWTRRRERALHEVVRAVAAVFATRVRFDAGRFDVETTDAEALAHVRADAEAVDEEVARAESEPGLRRLR